MNADEAEIALQFVAANWPTPEMGAEEVKAWIRRLAVLNFEDACDVIDLISKSGRQFRPTNGEFYAEYQTRRRRPKGFPSVHAGEDEPALSPVSGSACGHLADRVACDASVRLWVERCKRQLAEATGPMARSLSNIPTGLKEKNE